MCIHDNKIHENLFSTQDLAGLETLSVEAIGLDCSVGNDYVDEQLNN